VTERKRHERPRHRKISECCLFRASSVEPGGCAATGRHVRRHGQIAVAIAAYGTFVDPKHSCGAALTQIGFDWAGCGVAPLAIVCSISGDRDRRCRCFEQTEPEELFSISWCERARDRRYRPCEEIPRGECVELVPAKAVPEHHRRRGRWGHPDRSEGSYALKSLLKMGWSIVKRGRFKGGSGQTDLTCHPNREIHCFP
jgi:hypothetical protein